MEGKIIPPQLMGAWGCGFPAGTRQAGLTLERLQPPKSLSVPSCSHGSALTHSTHPSPPQQGPEPGVGSQGTRNQGRAPDHCPFPKH